MLDFDAFVVSCLGLLEIEPPPGLTPATGLFDDLALDSVQGFQLLLMIELLADADAPAEVPEIFTLQDAYDYYRMLQSRAAKPR